MLGRGQVKTLSQGEVLSRHVKRVACITLKNNSTVARIAWGAAVLVPRGRTRRRAAYIRQRQAHAHSAWPKSMVGEVSVMSRHP